MRGRRVMLDSDLAEVYGVETGALNRAVDRNQERFPDEFAFRVNAEEWDNLKCQIGISSSWGGRRRALPRVFTEYGATALSMILKSERAVAASVQIIRAFVRLRHVLDANQALARRIEELAAKVGDHDKAFAVVFEELKRLAVDIAPERPRERIGFKANPDRAITGKGRRG
ncbi:MAG: ORF6N domain-containing protein [Planctomycetota bacterium]|nr:ORF6N domain-containing protein [Planctomycetota bacterium]